MASQGKSVRIIGPGSISLYSVMLLFLFLLFAGISPIDVVRADAAGLDAAIESLRKVNIGKMSEEEQRTKSAEIDKSWETIKSAGNAGLRRIKKELSTIEDNREKDDFFRLNVSVLLWEIGKSSEAETIGKIWNSTPLNINYNYVFYTAFNAAKTQDMKIIPMLKPLLRDKSGSVFFANHSMRVAWPLTLEFIWGTFGRNGLPALHDVLEHSRDESEILSALSLIAESQYIDALPRIRQLARNASRNVRISAIRNLGVFGHPEDFRFLVDGLGSTGEKEELFSYVWALYEYDDTRAVQKIIPLLKNKYHEIRRESIATLVQLATVESFDALARQYKSCRDKSDIEIYKKNFEPIVNPDAYLKMSSGDKTALISRLVEKRRGKYRLKEDDRRINHGEFVKMAKHWISENRITGEKYKWVEDRHVLSVATDKDIDLLLDVKSSLYHRLSDECLYEVNIINNLIKILGRQRGR